MYTYKFQLLDSIVLNHLLLRLPTLLWTTTASISFHFQVQNLPSIQFTSLQMSEPNIQKSLYVIYFTCVIQKMSFLIIVEFFLLTYLLTYLLT